MHSTTGTVIEVNGSHAVVACAGSEHCARCAAGNGCGGALMGRLLGQRLRAVNARVPKALNVHTGDTVTLALADDAVMNGAAIVYLVPLSALLSGTLLGAAAMPAGGDVGALIGAGVGLLAGLGLARWFARSLSHRPALVPVILAHAVPGST